MADRRIMRFGDQQKGYLQDIKRLSSDQFKTRVYNFNHDVSPGDFPSEAFGVNRYLVGKHEVYQGEGSYDKRRLAVINHGTIVAGQNVFSNEYYSAEDTATGIQISGEINLSTDVTGNPITTTTEDGFQGHGIGVRSLLTVATGDGAAAMTDTYGALDVSHARFNPDGTAIAASDTFSRPRNIPIGIAHSNVFRDDVGEVLNYSTKVVLLESIQADYFVKVPGLIVDRAKTILDAEGISNSAAASAAAGTFRPAAAVGYDATTTNAYNILTRDFSYFYCNAADLVYGGFVMPDQNGNYIPQYAGANAAVGSTAIKNVQTVGKMFSLDNKFPKDNADMHLTYTGIGVTGSDTFGIPADLYIFAANYLLNSGVAAADVGAGVKALIDGAGVGHVTINLHVS
jgi:hypothetical protein